MKNKVIDINNDIVAIVINYKGSELLSYINRSDLPKVSSIRGTWHISVNRTGHLDGVKTKVQKRKVRKQLFLHNLVLEKSCRENVVDHIDHNTLNNTRNNLREVTKKQNAQNISVTLKSSTGIRNITLEGGRYRVRINNHSFGSYSTLEEAKVVADRERRKMFPISSTLNNKVSIK